MSLCRSLSTGVLCTMVPAQKRKYSTALIVAALIACAILARVIAKFGCFGARIGLLLGVLRTLIYIGLMAAWGISVRTRIVQVQVRRHLTSISCLIVFWFFIRSLKYYAVTDLNVARHIWYLYYIPMLLIPLLALFVALSLGKPENYRLPKWTHLLYIPTLLLLVLVLTNDLHQLVFNFPEGSVWTDKNNGYCMGYYFTFGWETSCALAALLLMGAKCPKAGRFSGNRLPRWSLPLPMVFFTPPRFLGFS